MVDLPFLLCVGLLWHSNDNYIIIAMNLGLIKLVDFFCFFCVQTQACGWVGQGGGSVSKIRSRVGGPLESRARLGGQGPPPHGILERGLCRLPLIMRESRTTLGIGKLVIIILMELCLRIVEHGQCSFPKLWRFIISPH